MSEELNKETVEEVSKSVETTESSEQPAQEEKQISPEKFLKDFNWHNYEEGIDPIEDSKLVEFEGLVKENFVDTLTDSVISTDFETSSTVSLFNSSDISE